MKTWLMALLLISCAALVGFQGPRCTAIDPDTAKSGDTVNASCENVDKTTVADVYLTDGKADTKVTVTENGGGKIKFQVPRMKPGRYHLAFLTANKASMIEQPI